jgi:hypothetical protein
VWCLRRLEGKPQTPRQIGAVRKQMDSPVCRKRCLRPHPATNAYPKNVDTTSSSTMAKELSNKHNNQQWDSRKWRRTYQPQQAETYLANFPFPPQLSCGVGSSAVTVENNEFGTTTAKKWICAKLVWRTSFLRTLYQLLPEACFMNKPHVAIGTFATGVSFFIHVSP